MKCTRQPRRSIGRRVTWFLVLVFVEPTILRAAQATFRYGGSIVDIAHSGDILYIDSVEALAPPKHRPLDAFGGVTHAVAISDDGKVITGNGTTPTGQFYRGWIKREGEDYVDIGTLGGDRTIVGGMSEDGVYVSGVSTTAGSDYQAFRWSRDTGMTPIAMLPRSTYVSGAGISADGSVVVGTASIVDERYDPGFVAYDCAGECGTPIAQYYQAFLWTEAGGTVSLGSLNEPPPQNNSFLRPPKPYDTHATAISRDGKSVVGYSWGVPLSGFIWRAETGMQPLPGLSNGYGLFMPLDVSGDGSVVVGGIGGSCGTNCFSGPGAVIWDAKHGTRLLKDVLVKEYGLGEEIGDDFLEHASFISADGRTIAGYGDRTRGLGSWIVALPYSPAVPEPDTILFVSASGLLMGVRFRRRRKA